MAFKSVQRLSVFLDIAHGRRLIGDLAWSRTERRAYFQYSPDFLAEPLPVSPFTLPVRAGTQAAAHHPFDGLHGLFNDSLPDGWGRKLVDRSLQRAGTDFRMLTPIDRLMFAGSTGMGALSYQPQFVAGEPAVTSFDLDWFSEQAEMVQSDITTAEVEILQGAQGGSGGARPKMMVGIRTADDAIVVDYGMPLAGGFENWIIKFKGTDDNPEIGAEEFAYSLMARAAGIDMPETQLIETARNNRFFAVKRFDRSPQGRHHVHTASGLVDADHRQPSMDYAMLLKLTRQLTRDERCVEAMFLRMVFNVYARNRDDHTKNHAFMMDADGNWHPTPAYDLTLSSGPAGEHSLSIAGEGRDPGLPDIVRLAASASVNSRFARDCVDRVRTVMARWPDFGRDAGLSKSRRDEIDVLLNGRHAGPTT